MKAESWALKVENWKLKVESWKLREAESYKLRVAKQRVNWEWQAGQMCAWTGAKAKGNLYAGQMCAWAGAKAEENLYDVDKGVSRCRREKAVHEQVQAGTMSSYRSFWMDWNESWKLKIKSEQ